MKVARNPMIKVSKSADGLAQRIAVMLAEQGPRNVEWFRSFAATDAIFDQAIGRLFIKGQVRFIGKKQGRRLARAA